MHAELTTTTKSSSSTDVHVGRMPTIQAWAERRLGKPADEITTADIMRRIPRPTGLRFGKREARSPLGGRLASHLVYLEDSEILARLQRANAFLAEISLTPAHEETAGPEVGTKD